MCLSSKWHEILLLPELVTCSFNSLQSFKTKQPTEGVQEVFPQHKPLYCADCLTLRAPGEQQIQGEAFFYLREDWSAKRNAIAKGSPPRNLITGED